MRGAGGSEIQGSVNGGFQTVVRVLSRDQIPLPSFDLNLTSFLPQVCLFFTLFPSSLKPPFNLCFVTSLEPRLGNHGLQTLGRPINHRSIKKHDPLRQTQDTQPQQRFGHGSVSRAFNMVIGNSQPNGT